MVAKLLLHASIDGRRKSSTVDIRVRNNGNALDRYNPPNDSARNAARSDDIRTAEGVRIKATVGRQSTLGVDPSVDFNTVVTGSANHWSKYLLSISLAELSNILIQIAVDDRVILVCFERNSVNTTLSQIQNAKRAGKLE